jgi:hypothetical protein
MKFENRIAELERETKAIKNELKEARVFTGKFLSICSKYKITRVAIGVSHESVKSSINFCFGGSGSIFSDEVRDNDDFPAIWKAVEEAGISGGCGNSYQHQADVSKLVEGTYNFYKNKWQKID